MNGELKLENSTKGLCAVCSEPIDDNNTWLCLKCNKQCQKVIYSKPLETKGDKVLLDVKSDCCNTDVKFLGRLTCSEKCHEKFVKYFEKEFGTNKKVIDDTTGMAYKVPTRDIIEKGITWQDLPKYPQWEEI